MGLAFKIASTANPAHFHPNWPDLAVLFSRQIPNSSQDFFSLTAILFFKFFRYETFETRVLTDLSYIIFASADEQCHDLTY